MSIRFIFRGVVITSAVLIHEAVAQVSGPVLTYARHDEVVRAVMGVPGAAYFGSAIDTAGLQIAAVSGESEYAVALNAERTSVSILRLRGSEGIISATALEFPSRVESVRLSPKGTSAAVVRGDAIDIIGGLPGNPGVTTSISIAAAAVAVADDGDAVLAVDNSHNMWLIEGGTKSQLPAIGVRDVAFRAGSHDFVYFDTHSVGAGSGRTLTSLAGTADGISAPKLARPSRDGRYTFILNGSGDEALIHHQAGGILARIALPCIASQGEWVLDSTVSVSCASSSSLHFVQITQSGARLLFIPEPVE